jgi:hypothetical protein
MSSNRTLRPIPRRAVHCDYFAFILRPNAAFLVVKNLSDPFFPTVTQWNRRAVAKLNRGPHEKDDEDIDAHSFSRHTLNAAFSSFWRSFMSK